MEGSEAGPAGGCSSLLTRLPLRWAGRGMHTDNSLRHISPMASSGLLEATSTGSAPDGYKAFSARRSSALVSDNPFVPLDRHLAQNPFICDCNLKWLADFLRTNPIETSGARCASPRRLANKRIGQIKSKKFRCSGKGHLCISSGLGDQECVLMALTKMSSVTFEPAGCRGGGAAFNLGGMVPPLCPSLYCSLGEAGLLKPWRETYPPLCSQASSSLCHCVQGPGSISVR